MIKVSNLNKYYYKNKSNEIHVINNFNIELDDTGMIALFGKSGCGKTTLLNALGGLDKVDSGEIYIDNQKFDYRNDDLKNEYIGYIFQNYNLNPEETVLENVSNALRLCGITDEKEIESRSLTALKNVGMEKFVSRTPNNLSGGQMQRIAIARAIVKNPKIILADEPTGNLDENNTILIMDLLREIADSHLVILVTHEANLVDYYCDQVIELDDGKIVNIKNNNSLLKHKTKNKNDIYLGDLNKSTSSNEYLNVEYYGDIKDEKIDIKIVNNNGKLYLQIDSKNINLINESSEVKLIDAKFEVTPDKEKKMEELPSIENGTYGKLFNFHNALKSGFKNFKVKKRGNRLLKITLVMLTAVLVFITSIFGTSFKKLKDINSSYSHNAFYVYIDNSNTYNKLVNDYNDGKLNASYANVVKYNNRQSNMSLNLGMFETYQLNYDVSISSEIVMLPSKLLENKKVLAGRSTDLKNDEIVISSKVADKLLEQFNVDFINKYQDLLGLTNTDLIYKKLSVVGIVEDTDIGVYVNDYVLASINNRNNYVNYFGDIEKYIKSGSITTTLNDNEGVLVYYSEYEFENKTQYQINGVNVKVVDSISYYDLFDEYSYYYDFSSGLYVNEATYIKIANSYGPTDLASYSYYDSINYYFVYSNNPKKTLEYINNNYSDIKVIDNSYYEAIYTPDKVLDEYKELYYSSIISKIVTMIVMFVLMSLCMYFIMRASLISKIKEVGIYRAIGVSKKNLLFKFLIESVILTLLTVGVSFLFFSGFVWSSLGISVLMEQVFYYPLWLSLVLLVLLFSVCILFGMLPISSLLRKTPSEILSKYDI